MLHLVPHMNEDGGLPQNFGGFAMSPAQAMKNSETVFNVIRSFHESEVSPISVVRAVASQDTGMDIRAAEDALCVLLETGRVVTNDDMNLVVKQD
jgi:hypothetical protein